MYKIFHLQFLWKLIFVYVFVLSLQRSEDGEHYAGWKEEEHQANRLVILPL